jgi:hypothetical protein
MQGETSAVYHLTVLRGEGDDERMNCSYTTVMIICRGRVAFWRDAVAARCMRKE